MHTPICEQLGIEVPIFAFSHCRDVVAAVTNAGGIGVLGGANFSPEELDHELTWLDNECNGRPYGIDLIFPITYAGDNIDELRTMIPEGHKEFVHQLEERFGIPPRRSVDADTGVRGHERARDQWAVALTHNVKLLASGLGPAPKDVQNAAHDAGIMTAGLIGAPEHARVHLEAGTDIFIAQGTEAGGHCGELGTFVLVPQVVDAVGDKPVLAAGGVGDGRQITAALALGAQGVWTGSIWLTTHESDTPEIVKQKLIAAGTRDTLRSKCRTGKTVRQLRTAWVDAWESSEAPAPLKAPLQQLLVRDATLSAIEHNVADAMGTPVGQVVGMMKESRSAKTVVQELVDEYVASSERVASMLESD